jgi:hypothetical protein
MSSFGLIEKNMELSHIYLAVRLRFNIGIVYYMLLFLRVIEIIKNRRFQHINFISCGYELTKVGLLKSSLHHSVLYGKFKEWKEKGKSIWILRWEFKLF